MKEKELSPWGNDYKQNAEIIHSIACKIQTYTKRVASGITQEQGEPLLESMAAVLDLWTGSTYVGNKKEKALEKAFQSFFKALYNFIIECRNNDRYFNIKRSNKILYRGTVYRYLGHSTNSYPDNSIVEPVFNDIYVSWSKSPKGSYIESKLRYPQTWLSAEIKEPYYGIDLVGLQEAILELVNVKNRIAIDDEREVVFPTIKECITEIKYIR